MSFESTLECAWSRNADDVVGHYDSDARLGLQVDEAARRLEICGRNRIASSHTRRPLQVFAAQFADLMIGLLIAAAFISGLIGEWGDAVLIAVIVLANAIIGFVQEWRAERAVEALKSLSQPHARVRRGGELHEIPVDEVVPGDLVELNAGDFVPADARVLESAELETDEASLTGESLPIEKSASAVEEQTALPDRDCMVHAGTAVVRGTGQAMVTATGMSTELGRIAELLSTADATQTPLQRRLARLGRKLAILVLGVCVLIFAAGVLRESPDDWNSSLLTTLLLTAVSLAVAAIPEGLPAVITVTLALGSQRMAKRNAIVRRLSAVETLGSVTVICSDKTGTLTKNRMQVADIVSTDDNEQPAVDLLHAAVLCNDAEVDSAGRISGSATESALFEAAVEAGIDIAEIRETHPRVGEIPFSSDRKRMATLHSVSESDNRIFVKGAIERVWPLCADAPNDIRQRADDLASSGRRVLAFATKTLKVGESLEDDAESDLRFLGIMGIIDPVRPEAQQAIARCRSAGIRPVMITGDHPGTARAIAKELDLWREGDGVVTGVELDSMPDEQLAETAKTASVYARVSPEHKLKIVRAHQSHGQVTSMTGDGVNDAPALKQADIGVAMGVTGTDVAKESSEMILADDNFATIVSAVEEGRVVYDNVRKFVAYMLTANAAEVLVLFLGIVLGLPIPLLPVHILWINLVTDGLPALALGFEPAEEDIMAREPRPRDEGMFGDGLGRRIVVVGSLMAFCCFAAFCWCLFRSADSNGFSDETVERARTILFLSLSLSQLFYVLAIRSRSETFFAGGLWSNYRLTVAVTIGLLLQLAVVYVPILQPFFHTTSLNAIDFLLAVAAALPAYVLTEISKRR